MKVAVSVLLAAAAIVPVANGFEVYKSLVTSPEDNEFESSFVRDFDTELEEREINDDIVEHEPFGGKFISKAFRMGRKGAGSIGSSVTPPQTPTEIREFDDDLRVIERESEELRRRTRGFSGGRGFSMKTSGGKRGRMVRPGSGGMGVRKEALGRIASSAPPPASPIDIHEFNDDLLEREFEDELYERERPRGSAPVSAVPVSPHVTGPSTSGSGTCTGPRKCSTDYLHERTRNEGGRGRMMTRRSSGGNKNAHISKMLKERDSQYDREKLKERLAKLSGGVAVIPVGTSTSMEIKQKKARIQSSLKQVSKHIK